MPPTPEALALLVLVASAAAVQVAAAPRGAVLKNMEVFVDISRDDSCSVEVRAVVTNPDDGQAELRSIRLPLQEAAGNSSVLEGSLLPVYGDVSVSIRTTSAGRSIIVTPADPVGPGGELNFSFRFNANPPFCSQPYGGNVNSSFRVVVFSIGKPNLTISPEVGSRVEVSIKLPVDSGVIQLVPSPIFYPPNPEIQLDSWERRVILTWGGLESLPGGGWSFRLYYYRGHPPTSIPVAPNPVIPNRSPSRGEFSPDPVIFVLLGTNVVTLILALLAWRRSGNPPPGPGDLFNRGVQGFVEPSIIRDLDPDERTVVEILAENQGSMPQKDLPYASGFSKSKISRILKRLEGLGIVSRTTSGKTKIVELDPNLFVALRSGEGEPRG